MALFDLLHDAVGCDWGYKVSTHDDSSPCLEQAVRRYVAHDPHDVAIGKSSTTELKLCAKHSERFEAETDPHR